MDCTLLASVIREPQNSGNGPDKSGPVKCSGYTTNEPPGSRCCCYGCRVDSCCDWLSVRSWNCCSTNRHATHDSRTSLYDAYLNVGCREKIVVLSRSSHKPLALACITWPCQLISRCRISASVTSPALNCDCISRRRCRALTRFCRGNRR